MKRAAKKPAPSSASTVIDPYLPKSGNLGQTVALPGTLQGFVQSPISARASGYLRRWTKDIGTRVEKGELLAILGPLKASIVQK